MGYINTYDEYLNSFENKVLNQPHTLEENIEFYRNRMIETDNPDERVLSRFYGFPTNKCQPMLVEKITIDRIVNKRGNKGIIYISAWRTNKGKETNEKNTKELIKDIKRSGFQHLPVYRGYRDRSKGEDSDFEPSFLIFNYNKKGETQDWEKLKKWGIELCKKYEQSSVLVKAPFEPPVWLDENGDKVSKKETNIVFKNDSNKPYYTSLKSLEEIENEVKKYLWKNYLKELQRAGKHLNKKDQKDVYDSDDYKEYCQKNWSKVPVSIRYSHDMKHRDDLDDISECYVNPSPCDRNERIFRHLSGEILVMLELFDE